MKSKEHILLNIQYYEHELEDLNDDELMDDHPIKIEIKGIVFGLRLALQITEGKESRNWFHRLFRGS